MKRHLNVLIALLLTPLLLADGIGAQTEQARSNGLPKFDVASVKQDKQGGPSNAWQLVPGRINYNNSQIRALIRVAWNDNSMRMENGPDWIVSDRFDVIVQFPAATAASAVGLMMRDLLIDRFRLAAHVERRTVDVFHLIRAHSDGTLGAGLAPGLSACVPPWSGRSTSPPECGSGATPGRIQLGSIDMARFAQTLSELQAAGRPVVDTTGLAGSYRVDLTYSPDIAPSPDVPTIFTAIQEQLGLRLQSARADVSVLVIDHIERPVPD